MSSSNCFFLEEYIRILSCKWKDRERGRRKVSGPGPACLSPPLHVFRAAVGLWVGRVPGAYFCPQHITLLSTGPWPGAGWKHPSAPCSPPREHQHCSNISHILGSHFPIMNVTFSNFVDIFKNSHFHQSIIIPDLLWEFYNIGTQSLTSGVIDSMWYFTANRDQF